MNVNGLQCYSLLTEFFLGTHAEQYNSDDMIQGQECRKNACWVPGLTTARCTEAKVVNRLHHKVSKKKHLTREQFMKHIGWTREHGESFWNSWKNLGVMRLGRTLSHGWCSLWKCGYAYSATLRKGVIYRGVRMLTGTPLTALRTRDCS